MSGNSQLKSTSFCGRRPINALQSCTQPVAAAVVDHTTPSSNQLINDDPNDDFDIDYHSDPSTEFDVEIDDASSTRSKSVPSINHLFKLNHESGKYKCLICDGDDEYSGSDVNLRKHLFHCHGMVNYLYESQKKALIKNYGVVDANFDIKTKKELDKASIQCVVEDSRTFVDFKKSGMKHFLNVAVPGYKSPNEKTISKNLRLKYVEYRKT